MFKAGHFYSPIPDKKDIQVYLQSRKTGEADVAGVKMNKDSQYSLVQDFIVFYKDLEFPHRKNSGKRYYYENDWFSYCDAIFLYSFLRKYKPRKIIEVGTGYSSAVMLDTVDQIFTDFPDITFIDPYPQRLNGLLKENDKENVKLMEKKVQDVPIEVFTSLEKGDLLFIDSSHVLKAGSDVQMLLFEVLPLLKPGVFVQFHDVFYPFDYPSEWLKEGRYWNENYFLRAFLSYNDSWEIVLFNSYVNHVFNNLIKYKMPLTQKETGGCLYIQRL
jgi:predicted O-methyltransferase YrrM